VASDAYVHGYSERETERLCDQAAVLAPLLHGDTRYPPGCRVLEIGCGVGAQTVLLAGASPEAQILSVDRSFESVREARAAARRHGRANVRFAVGDVLASPWPEASFDHVFVCFVLEHLADPLAALRALRAALRPGGTLTVIEGDHGSAFFYPDSEAARRAIRGLVDAQARAGGDALIGRRLYPLLCEAGFREVHVTPRAVYADASRPEMVRGFTELTFTAMVAGARESVLGAGLVDGATWEQGISGLRRTTEPDGSFFYCFFKAVALR
jgi:SAM-dependent methyltransferase